MNEKEIERENLIALCERAIVPQDKWGNRDSSGAQEGVGKAWAYLKAGCDFVVHDANGDPEPTDSTIWLTIRVQGFNYFEGGWDGEGDLDRELIYLPTEKRLAQAAGSDWY